MRTRLGFGALFLQFSLFAALLPPHAEAQPALGASAHLQWDRPVGSTCIGEAELAQRVESLIGRSVFVDATHTDLRIVGSVARVGGGWVATVRVAARGAGDHGVRELHQEGNDCAALNPALTVVLATLIDLAQPGAAQRHPLPIAVGLAGGFGLGALPKLAAAGSLWLGAMPGAAWWLWLDASAWLPVEQLDTSQRGGTFSAWQAGLSLCRELRGDERLALALCLGGQLGAIDGVGRNLGPNRSSQRLLAQTDLEGAVSLRMVSVVALRLSTLGVLNLSRPSFFLEQPDGKRTDLFRPSWLGLSVRLGVVVELR